MHGVSLNQSKLMLIRKGLGLRPSLMNCISSSPELFNFVRTAGWSSGELSLEYEEKREKSYSKVIMKFVSHSMQHRYEHQSLMEPTIQEIPLKEFCPLEMWPLVRVCVGKLHYFDLVSKPSQYNPEVQELLLVFPHSNEQQERLILYPPPQLWGYDTGRL